MSQMLPIRHSPINFNSEESNSRKETFPEIHFPGKNTESESDFQDGSVYVVEMWHSGSTVSFEGLM